MTLMKSRHKNRFDFSELADFPEVTTREAARSMGFVSIAIGLTEVLAPKALDKFLGTGKGENAGVFRVLGIREICHGIDLLAHDDPTPGIMARNAGDALDGVMLGVAAAKTRKPSGVLAAIAMVLPVVAADLFFAKRLAIDEEEKKRKSWWH